VAWAACFRTQGNYANYVSYVRLGCELVGAPADATYHPSVKRARASLAKRCRPPKAKHFVRHELLIRLMRAARADGCLAEAMLYCMAYAFLLRVPSEGLPVSIGALEGDRSAEGRPRAALFRQGDAIVLELSRRKNRPFGSTLKRECWCSRCEDTCPVHQLSKWIADKSLRSLPFESFTSSGVNVVLRHWLRSLGVENANEYSSKCFRRGHAQDLLEGRSHTAKILSAGEWRSHASKSYVEDADALEERCVAETAAAAESSDSDLE